MKCLRELGIKITQSNVGYGNLGVDGRLGYDYAFTSDKVYLNHRQECEAVISAHAPSTVEITITEPLAVAGATHVSFWASAEANFWIDWHHIGTVREPGDVTPWIHLAPGHYKLKTDIAHKDWAHTLWLFKRDHYDPSGRLALVTVGAYRESELQHKLRWIFSSSAQHGILVHVHGVNEAIGNWFTRKIELLAEFIGSLPDVYQWILYADGNDCMILDDERAVIKALSDYAYVCIGAEACPWPCEDEQFTAMFSAPTIHRFPQAGCWGGHRNLLLRTLWELQMLHYDLKNGIGPSWCFRDGKPIANLWDDQFLWQVLHCVKRHELFQPDYYWKVIANLTCTNVNPFITDTFHIAHNRIVTRWDTRPVVVHVSGWRKELPALWFGIMRQ